MTSQGVFALYLFIASCCSVFICVIICLCLSVSLGCYFPQGRQAVCLASPKITFGVWWGDRVLWRWWKKNPCLWQREETKITSQRRLECSASQAGAVTQKGLPGFWSGDATWEEIIKERVHVLRDGKEHCRDYTWVKTGTRGRPKNLARVCHYFWKGTIVMSKWTFQNWSLAKIICDGILSTHLANVDWMSVTCQPTLKARTICLLQHGHKTELMRRGQ